MTHSTLWDWASFAVLVTAGPEQNGQKHMILRQVLRKRLKINLSCASSPWWIPSEWVSSCKGSDLAQP